MRIDDNLIYARVYWTALLRAQTKALVTLDFVTPV